MDRGRVGEDRGSKETDGCPLTDTAVTPYARSLIVKEQLSELSHYILLMSGDLLP
jgi:hypothetical protein